MQRLISDYREEDRRDQIRGEALRSLDVHACAVESTRVRVPPSLDPLGRSGRRGGGGGGRASRFGCIEEMRYIVGAGQLLLSSPGSQVAGFVKEGHCELTHSGFCFRTHFRTRALGGPFGTPGRSGRRELEVECGKIDIQTRPAVAEPIPHIPAHSGRGFGHLDGPGCQGREDAGDLHLPI